MLTCGSEPASCRTSERACASANLTSETAMILNADTTAEVTAAEQLMPLVYEELRHLAAARMAHELPGHTLQPTALVHEAWLRLVADGAERNWRDRAYFFAPQPRQCAGY